MDCIIRRTSFTPGGVFSNLFDAKNNLIGVTGTHSYGLLPKLADGQYVCRRGMFRLEHELKPSERFQVLDVPDFQGAKVTGLLFHNGNFPQVESKGCELLGKQIQGSVVLHSVDMCEAFMALQAGLNEFGLTVKSGVVTC